MKNNHIRVIITILIRTGNDYAFTDRSGRHKFHPFCVIPTLFPEQLDWPDAPLTVRESSLAQKVHAVFALSSQSLDSLYCLYLILVASSIFLFWLGLMQDTLCQCPGQPPQRADAQRAPGSFTFRSVPASSTVHGHMHFPDSFWVHIVMELVDLGSFADLLKRPGGGAPARMLSKIACQTLLGRERLHERGITHRDIKPSSILPQDRGQTLLQQVLQLPHLPDSISVDLGRQEVLGVLHGAPGRDGVFPESLHRLPDGRQEICILQVQPRRALEDVAPRCGRLHRLPILQAMPMGENHLRRISLEAPAGS